MDKEAPEINPTSLEGVEVNTIHTADLSVQEAEQEKSQDYYIDPLEQDAVMQEKLKKIEEQKAIKQADGESEEEAPTVDETIRPDLNVTGYFSNGATAAKKQGLKSPASGSTLKLCFVMSIMNVMYAIVFLVLLLGSKFSVSWVFALIYVYAIGSSIFVAINGFRSLNIPNEELKKYAMIGLICSGITAVPLPMLLIHMITG